MSELHRCASIDPSRVAAAHDEMADDYDQLDDLWYSWLFARLHEFLTVHLLPFRESPRPVAVDVGCGTGFQSYLLARGGFDVEGIDLAARLLEVARNKVGVHADSPLEAPPLFLSRLTDAWLTEHHQNIACLLERVRHGRSIVAPRFVEGNVSNYEFGTARSDVIVCCGSVLSFLDDYVSVIAKMARGLRPGGRLFLEVEQKVNLDLLWPIADRLVGGRLGYEQTWTEIARNLASPSNRSVRIDYPFELRDGSTLELPIWLFSIHELERAFRNCGLRVVDRLGIHAATNLLPSTLLHTAEPGALLRAAFAPLRLLDQAFGQVWPFWGLGCSAVYALERVEEP